MHPEKLRLYQIQNGAYRPLFTLKRNVRFQARMHPEIF